MTKPLNRLLSSLVIFGMVSSHHELKLDGSWWNWVNWVSKCFQFRIWFHTALAYGHSRERCKHVSKRPLHSTQRRGWPQWTLSSVITKSHCPEPANWENSLIHHSNWKLPTEEISWNHLSSLFISESATPKGDSSFKLFFPLNRFSQYFACQIPCITYITLIWLQLPDWSDESLLTCHFSLVDLFCGCWLNSYAKLFCSPKPEIGK